MAKEEEVKDGLRGFPNVLSHLMKESGVRAVDLAKRLEVSESIISQLVNGKRQPGLRTLVNLSQVFSAPIDVFLSGLDQPDLSTFVRKLPVINRAQLEKWDSLNNYDYPKLATDLWFYGVSEDPHAFFLMADGFTTTCSNVKDGDWLLIEPFSDEKSGDMVLVYEHEDGSWRLARYLSGDDIGSVQPLLTPVYGGGKPQCFVRNNEKFLLWRVTLLIRRKP